MAGAEQTRPALAASATADVAIVGAGYTGLWCAYYVKRAQPDWHVLVLEREFAGFGASGRNGGWVSGFFPGTARSYQRRGSGAYAALQQAMFETVDEVARVLSEEAIDADLIKSGQLTVALDDAQAARLGEAVARRHVEGVGEHHLRTLGEHELRRRLRISDARCASYSPDVARVQPVKLLTGLAAAVERLGVTIHERTAVSALRAREAITPAGAVRARWVVRACEGYTPDLRPYGRTLVPLNSSMIITAPLEEDVWRQIGWSGRELLSDNAHVYCYLQRTADGRIAIGGRGIPYRFGSRTATEPTPAATVAALRERLAAMFPALQGVQIEDAWSGVLGVARDWCMSVGADEASGLAWAGGYVGQGVASANLAGRTLADLLAGRDTGLTRLPWVGHRARSWEPEPLRFSAIRGVYALYRAADRRERRSGRRSRLGDIADAISARR